MPTNSRLILQWIANTKAKIAFSYQEGKIEDAKKYEESGWFAGYVERGNKTYIFATNIESKDNASGIKAKKITLEILKKLKII